MYQFTLTMINTYMVDDNIESIVFFHTIDIKSYICFAIKSHNFLFCYIFAATLPMLGNCYI